MGPDIYVRSAAISNYDNNFDQDINTIKQFGGTAPFESLIAPQGGFEKTTGPSEQISVESDENENKRSYIDIEEFNTSKPQRRKLYTLLSQNGDKLKRRRRTRHVIDFDSTAAFDEHDEQVTHEGANRLIKNLNTAICNGRHGDRHASFSHNSQSNKQQ